MSSNGGRWWDEAGGAARTPAGAVLPVVVGHSLGTVVTLRISTGLPRMGALALRDEVVAHLAGLGLRVSMVDDGTDVSLVGVGVPTTGDLLAGDPADVIAAMAVAAHGGDADAAYRWAETTPTLGGAQTPRGSGPG